MSFSRQHQPVLKACYGRPEDKSKLEEFANRWGYQSIETDWRKIIERKDIDLIDVCVPNHMHHDAVIAAAPASAKDKLRLLVWEGYAEKDWVAEFEKANDADVQVVYLASDAAAYITGQILYLDGGWTA